ncbi:MAG: RNA-directed DNA polymerase [bacterium]
MKSYNHLFEELISYDNLHRAIINSSRRKRKREDVQKVLSNPSFYIEKLQAMLLDKTYAIQKHKAIEIFDGSSKKTRLIIQPKYLFEQIIQHAIVQVLSPIFMKGMYEFSCGSIPNRGCHYGKRHIEKFIRENENSPEIKYILKMDIHHYYQSVDIGILKEKLKKIIRDEKMLYVIDLVLDSNIAEHEGELINMGLPIGFYTSQWFANWFLQDFDHIIKEKLHTKCYVRYVDDIVLFNKNKKELHKNFATLKKYLNSVNLEIKGNWQVFKFEYTTSKGNKIGRPLDFMGFKFYRDKTTLRKSIMLKATRKALRLKNKEKITWYDASQLLSYMGWFKSTDTYNVFQKYIKPNVNIKACKLKIGQRQRLINKERTNELNLQTG